MASADRPPFVALVEDSPDDAAMTTRAVRKAIGVEPILYKEGQTAIEGLTSAAAPPDLVFLDARLPQMDGLAVLRALRSHPATRFVSIVIMTSGIEDAKLKSFYQSRANAVLSKPTDYDEYVARIRSACAVWIRVAERPSRFVA